MINFSGDAEWVRSACPGGRWRVALDTCGFDEFSSPSQADRILDAEAEPWHGQPFSVTVRLAALSGLYLVPVEDDTVTGEVVADDTVVPPASPTTRTTPS